MKVTLKDGVVKEFPAGTTAIDVAFALSEGLARAACAAEINGEVCDLRTELAGDCALNILTADSEGGIKALWHTASHVMAQAVKRLYPDCKLAIGPATDEGFYYDFDSERAFTPEDLGRIEAEMKKIAKENLKLERFVLSRGQALEAVRDEPYKTELIEDLPEDAEISFYRQGDFCDLCAGPHLMSTGPVKAVKLLQCTGAYWRGDSSKKMLQRIYGVAYPKASLLEARLAALEEAKKRDHNKIGRELGYFTTVDYIGQGLPIFLPKGAKVMQVLQRFVEDEEQRRGYILTRTPFMAKRDLYKISGHWDHYREGMFILGDPDGDKEVFALRPMTCPFQFQVYLNQKRSYRDLPMRFNEASTLFRNEDSGEMHGLIRVRQFTITEGHIACAPEQLEEEFKGCVDLCKFMLTAVGLEKDVTYRFSKWDENDKEKYIGSPEEWEQVQNRMRAILDHLGIDYVEKSGEAAFYGPKLDVQMKNVHGKEDTLATIQIDFQLAERFGMKYVDKDGETKFPYVIHRTSLGCYERTLALMIEKFAGALPTWVAAVQAVVLPITDRSADYAEKIAAELRSRGFRAQVDARSEKIGFKIREAQLEKTPYMLIVGDKEQEQGVVSVRSRKDGDVGQATLEEFIAKLKYEVDNRVIEEV